MQVVVRPRLLIVLISIFFLFGIAGNAAQLKGHIHPKARPEFDRGRVSTDLSIESLALFFQPTAEQQADLERLLAEQQDPGSPNYHQWLTPDQFADRFGASAEQIALATRWLESQNLHVTGVARGRTAIRFRGSAADVEKGFQTELHNFVRQGQTFFANVTNPSVPDSLAGFVQSVHGLNSVRFQPRSTMVAPDYTSSGGSHYLSPGDFATIYDVLPLYSAGFDGTGQKIVVAGQTQVHTADLSQFRSRFGLSATLPQMLLVPNTTDPGVQSSDMIEADLDLEWAAAVAPNATVIYVYSQNVMDAVQYAIDQNLAPVLSLSYGGCEPDNPLQDVLTLQSWARQANAQGMTWIAAAGDSGGADCVGDGTASSGLSVDIPASIPEVTGLGGTEFNEGGTLYWSSTSGSSGISALSYIPEKVWNDSTPGNPASGGGGVSTYFAKPSWQTGPGVPADGHRDVPDVSLTASAAHDGYLVYTGGQLAVIGGTSAAAPTFAGIATLLNQYLVAKGLQPKAGLGNMNPALYGLAQSTPSAFHDVTQGSNVINVSCGSTANCTSGSYGYYAGTGYDPASGLGSVDAYKLVSSWKSPAARALSAPIVSVTASSPVLAPSQNTVLTVTVTGVNGVTPTGSVVLSDGSVSLGSLALAGSGGVAIAALAVSGGQLFTGASTITAQYGGDSVYTAAAATVGITVTQAAPLSSAPFGSFDLPLNNSTVMGAVAVSGWALSGTGIAKVDIWREPNPGEGSLLVYVGDATLISGGRPDVQQQYSTYPGSNQAGWGMLLLTNVLPGSGGALGNGTYRIHAIAHGKDGQALDLGTKTIVANNASATLPFGTIDTPAQGGTASGSGFVSYGWVLTPNRSNVIAKDGSTITVFIDNKAAGHPVYNLYRADIAASFPGLQNSNGAVGYYVIDTTKLSNGVHQLAWSVTDSAGNSQGIGSRVFTVQN